MLGHEYDCLAKIGTGKQGQTSKDNMCQLELTIKDKNIWKKSPFVADFGCNR